ncbi:ABC transporter substrate-binding protein [Pseudomonas syringae]|uniref:Phosphonate transport system substrate-binding protein n=2 Tax=Pseudomonas TaxID=286 RepID=A0AB37ZFY0_PSESX|nr:PhnD/SsuA/transferrin family substrate-binding protein [Pseudomonas syringae]RMS19947.1 Phosphonate ABC-type transport system, periplasmic substrate-binding protein [Pseudomonas syringae pv. aceris]SDH03971.1 phosphonate transport system substrate-binding protein [Pseudomonas sp. BS3767]SDM44832.1 phosphonate transport system substrate-binding protein [Pseudomonas sp. BS3759]NAP18484.1 PhnD/SsuA/transferrin family substrate-binding protein [Pseudomonas syringae]
MKLRLSCKAIMIALSFALSNVAISEELKVYNFSPVNQYNLNLSASFWNPIIKYVSEKSGVNLTLKLGRTSSDTTSYVLAQEVDFAFTNHLFSPERDKMGWKVFGRRDAPALEGQIVVPDDSPIHSLSELEGKEVVYPGPEAFIAYKVTSSELVKKGINTSTVFAGNMDGAFSQLLSGKAQAMGANSQLVSGYTEREGKSFRVLWSSASFNDLALMASPRVSKKERDAVANAFFNMQNDPDGSRVLREATELVHAPAPITFIPATEADYASYRDFYNSLPANLK